MYKNDMLAFAGGERRAGKRRELAVEARAHSFEKRPCRVHVSNLSPRGCQLDASSHTGAEGLIYLDFAGLPLIGAKIVWQDDYHAGCEFVTPLTPEEFEILVQSDWSCGPIDADAAPDRHLPGAIAQTNR